VIGSPHSAGRAGVITRPAPGGSDRSPGPGTSPRQPTGTAPVRRTPSTPFFVRTRAGPVVGRHAWQMELVVRRIRSSPAPSRLSKARFPVAYRGGSRSSKLRVGGTGSPCRYGSRSRMISAAMPVTCAATSCVVPSVAGTHSIPSGHRQREPDPATTEPFSGRRRFMSRLVRPRGRPRERWRVSGRSGRRRPRPATAGAGCFGPVRAPAS
jgi:hypothetical protein